ncbi:hypothetical protein, partial [Pseudomonas savastanoi]
WACAQWGSPCSTILSVSLSTPLLSHTERPRQGLRWFLFHYTLDPYVHKFIFEFFNEFRKKAFMNSLWIPIEFL